ncbi:fructosamine kinase family protein [Pseudodonghicola flavimaris]|uniref:Fructosamine kinase family protein n=1 Tax=Pseudodonghicola flavimaris TaxID=3050036 RepID=A0ABT7EXL0_9RHOB|nr:fructosamine kinase family protein [Pseudodonghicola flavimaris]MDK3017074.1 fructosamine kinase family protein [Pseudodonghicola flavimaris]
MGIDELAAAAAAMLKQAPKGWRQLGGGDLNVVLALDLADGRAVVVKTGPAPRAEAAMLLAIRSADVPAPRVLAVSDRCLVMERLESAGGLSVAGWWALGEALRRLHETPGIAYGWECDYAFGPVPIRNAPAPSWPEFWAERRLLSDPESLPARYARRLERLARDLPNRLPESPPPVLLHGDLWAGNVLAAEGQLSGLVDPACYCGHGEVDLAMLNLFGSPGAGFAAGYGALEPGAAERQPIYQLWPAIVHLRLFGGGYVGLLDRLLVAAGV